MKKQVRWILSLCVMLVISGFFQIEVLAKETTYQLSTKDGGDITEELQKAVRSGYSSITIPKGSYTCTGINMSGCSGVTINATNAVIHGGKTSIIWTTAGSTTDGITIKGGEWKGTADAPIFRFYGNTTNLRLSSLKIKDAVDAGIRIADAKTVTIDKVTVHNNRGFGLNLDTVSNAKIKNSVFSDNSDAGLRVYKSNNVSISECEVRGNVGIGLSAAESTRIKIDGITATDNKNYGIYFKKVSKSSYLKNGSMSNNKKSGLNVTDCKELVLEKASCVTNGEHGIYVSNSSTEVNSCSAKSNYWSGLVVTGKKAIVKVKKGKYYGNGTRVDKYEGDDQLCAGIGVYRGGTATVTEAECSNNHGCGITAAGIGKQKLISTVNVYGCTINTNGDHGIGARPYGKINVSKSPSGKKNLISNNKSTGYMLCDNSTADIVSDCTIKKNGKAGISISISSEAKNISNNVIQDNKEDGIHISRNSKAFIKSCTVQRNKQGGLGVYSISTVKIGPSCKFNNNKSYGVVIDRSTAKEIVSAQISGNSNAGVMVRNKGKITLLRNSKMKNNGSYGLYCGKAGNVTVRKCTIIENKNDGIRITDKNSVATVSNSTIITNKGSGVVVTKNAVVKQLLDCKTNKNGSYGVYCANRGTITINKGQSISNKKDGVRLTGSGTVATISKYTVNQNKQSGIVITTNARLKSLVNTVIKKNKKHGLVVQGNGILSNYKANVVSANKSYNIYVNGGNTTLKSKR